MNNSIFSNLENINLDEFNVFQKNDLDYNLNYNYDNNYDFDKSLEQLLDNNFNNTNNNNYTDLYNNTDNTNINNINSNINSNNINTSINTSINTIKPNQIFLQNKPPISFIFVVYTTDVKEDDILEQFHDDIFIKQKDVFDFIKKKNIINCNKTTTDLYQAKEDLFSDDFKIDFKTKLKISICESVLLKVK